MCILLAKLKPKMFSFMMLPLRGRLVTIAAWLSFCAGAPAETYHNPVIPGDHPDPSIIRVGKEYWATATSSEWGPQFPLLHSKDLVNWDLAGSVFSHRPAWAVGNFWAPEISTFGGRFYVYYVGRKPDGPLSVAVASADKPGGPYHDHGPIVSQDDGSIDPMPVSDENGRRFLVWKEDGNSANRPSILWAQQLNEQGDKLLGQPTELLRNDVPWEGAVVEGPYVLRRDGYFYLFYSGGGCCGRKCNYGLGVARAGTLLGPYEKNPANPILSDNGAWRCPGHGSLTEDSSHRVWLLYHAYSATNSIFTGREALLDEVTFAPSQWPAINQGRGPGTGGISPFGRAQSIHPDFVDRFDQLQPGWQWPQDREPAYTCAKGSLMLRSGSQDAFMARSSMAGDYSATVSLDTQSVPAGTLAGIAVIGDAGNAIGLGLRDSQLVLWRRAQGKQREMAEGPQIKSQRVSLRIEATGGRLFKFSANTGKGPWTHVGESQDGTSLPPWDRSLRVGLNVFGGPDGVAVFREFSMKLSK
jgi:xylan 1,4-beta-xylosidase